MIAALGGISVQWVARALMAAAMIGLVTWFADTWFDKGQAAQAAANAGRAADVAEQIEEKTRELEANIDSRTLRDATIDQRRLLFAPTFACADTGPHPSACTDTGGDSGRGSGNPGRSGNAERGGPIRPDRAPSATGYQPASDPSAGAREIARGTGGDPVKRTAALLVVVAVLGVGGYFAVLIGKSVWRRRVQETQIMQLEEAMDRPLVPRGVAKIMLGVIMSVIAFFAVWAFDANAKISAQTAEISGLKADVGELQKELKRSNALLERISGQLEGMRMVAR